MAPGMGVQRAQVPAGLPDGHSELRGHLQLHGQDGHAGGVQLQALPAVDVTERILRTATQHNLQARP